MHTLSHPVYASKYQPGQSLFLAFGQRVLGNPYFGVVLSVGLMVAAMYWMLRAWATARLVLLGGMFALLSFHVNNYWMQSYWGGAADRLRRRAGRRRLWAPPHLVAVWPRSRADSPHPGRTKATPFPTLVAICAVAGPRANRSPGRYSTRGRSVPGIL